MIKLGLCFGFSDNKTLNLHIIMSVMGNKRNVLLLTFVMLVSVAMGANKKFTLVIDPGHGGHDAGALGSFSKEKNINLKVALAFGRYVENNCPDVKVIYTRKTDVFIPLHERASIANRNKANLFVSVHTNALPGGKVGRGMETYTLGMHRAADNFDVAKRENEVILIEKDYKQRYQGFDPRSSESYIMFEFIQDKNMANSVDMAKFVQQNVCATAGRPNKGVKQAGFLVLRETSMPSCLIELGFITTADEERLLNDANKVDAIGRGIYQAFVKYKKKYGEGLGVPFAAATEQETAVPSVVPQEYRQRAEQRQEARSTQKRKKNQPLTPAEEESQENLLQPQNPYQNPLPTASQQQSRLEPQDDELLENPQQVLRSSISVINDPLDVNAAMPSAPAAPESHTSALMAIPDATDAAMPVFKVQIMATDYALSRNDRRFRGVVDYDVYEENRLFKYTVGASTDYNAIYQLRKTLLDRFPEAFIIAFRNGQKMDVRQAIREFKANRK
ncbi:MAG: N-acetylmuramoyl-L-alanine amidase [Prevotella sp.]|nr:N-acetylmuramoyl-L-alanine amidase [Prevotella sp.]